MSDGSGLIRKALSGFYYVDDGGGELIACRARGKFRHQRVTPLVGDRVRFTRLPDGAGALDEILPRKNEFQRPAVANIDQLVIIASGAIPVTDPFLIDRVAASPTARRAAAASSVSTSATWRPPRSSMRSTPPPAFLPSGSAPRRGRVSRTLELQYPERYLPLQGIPVWASPAS